MSSVLLWFVGMACWSILVFGCGLLVYVLCLAIAFWAIIAMS